MNGVVHFDTELSAERRAQWDEFVSTSPHTAARQNSIYYGVEVKNFDRVYYVWAENNGAIAFAGIFCLERFIARGIYSEAICWRGPVFDDPDFAIKCLSEVTDFFQTMRIGSVRISPRWIFPEADSVETLLFDAGFFCFENHKRRSTGLIDIARPDDVLIYSFSKSTRQQIRLAQRAGVNVRPAIDSSEADLFFDQLTEMHKERGLMLEQKTEFQSIFNAVLVNSEYGIVLNAYWKELYLGGLLLYRLGNTANSYKLVVVAKVDNALATIRISPLLFFEGMRWARNKGSSVLDLDGYSSDVESAGHLRNVYQYKHGFRPKEVQTLSQYAITINNNIYLLWRLYKYLLRVKSIPNRLRFRRRIKRLKDRGLS